MNIYNTIFNNNSLMPGNCAAPSSTRSVTATTSARGRGARTAASPGEVREGSFTALIFFLTSAGAARVSCAGRGRVRR